MRRRLGYSLADALAGLAVSALALAVLVDTLGAARRVWERVEATSDMADDQLRAHRAFRHAVERVGLVDALGGGVVGGPAALVLIGRDRTPPLTAETPATRDPTRGWTVTRLTLDDAETGRRLSLHQTRASATTALNALAVATRPDAELRDPQRRRLVGVAEDSRFRYYGAASPGGAATWRDQWPPEALRAAPELVALVLGDQSEVIAGPRTHVAGLCRVEPGDVACGLARDGLTAPIDTSLTATDP